MIKRVVSGAVLVLFLAAVILFNRSFPLALNLVGDGLRDALDPRLKM